MSREDEQAICTHIYALWMDHDGRQICRDCGAIVVDVERGSVS